MSVGGGVGDSTGVSRPDLGLVGLREGRRGVTPVHGRSKRFREGRRGVVPAHGRSRRSRPVGGRFPPAQGNGSGFHVLGFDSDESLGVGVSGESWNVVSAGTGVGTGSSFTTTLGSGRRPSPWTVVQGTCPLRPPTPPSWSPCSSRKGPLGESPARGKGGPVVYLCRLFLV